MSLEISLVIRSLTSLIGRYAGSKAAMTAISEALRLKLTPFGVTVVMVNIGAVNTNTLVDGINFKLPSTSRKALKKRYQVGREARMGRRGRSLLFTLRRLWAMFWEEPGDRYGEAHMPR